MVLANLFMYFDPNQTIDVTSVCNYSLEVAAQGHISSQGNQTTTHIDIYLKNDTVEFVMRSRTRILI